MQSENHVALSVLKSSPRPQPQSRAAASRRRSLCLQELEAILTQPEHNLYGKRERPALVRAGPAGISVIFSAVVLVKGNPDG